MLEEPPTRLHVRCIECVLPDFFSSFLVTHSGIVACMRNHLFAFFCLI